MQVGQLIPAPWVNFAPAPTDVLSVVLLLIAAIGVVHAIRRPMEKLLRNNEALSKSEEKYRDILARMDEGYYEVDLTGNLTFYNPALARILGYPSEKLPGSNIRLFIDEQSAMKAFQIFDRVAGSNEPACNAELEIIRADGTRHTVSISVQLIRDKHGQPIGFRGLHQDITLRKLAERASQHRALYDALTDLPNRYLLLDRLAQAVAFAARANGACAILVLDLNDFKEINDTLGHMAGDVLLKQIGPRLRGCVRGTDTLARLGGDEFAIVLPGADETQAERVAHAVLDALVAPLNIDGVVTQINASIGIAQYPQHGQTPEELLQRADVAMYDAKRSHSGYARYAPEHDPYSRERLTLIGDLHQAIKRNELALHYQPKLHLRKHRLLGMEALVRWHHPNRGLIPPNDFLPLAEKYGETKPLTLWVLRAAARQWAEWRALGLEILIAVNLSPAALRDPDFPGQVLALLDNTVEPCAWLELEITENAIMTSPALMLERLRPLRARGVRLSISNFGAGYSSLSYLRELQADTLKIDQTLVRDIATNESGAMIVRAIIELAHNLGMEVVAEGVSSQGTYDRLRALDCDAVQGYYLGRPMPAMGGRAAGGPGPEGG